MGKVATRKVFGETLAALGAEFSSVVVLDADLSKSTMSMHFAKEFPDRFIEMGIAEANMIGTAAGLAFSGKIPFICSFACFLTGRYDTIRMSIAYANANVKLIGTHAGVGIGEDGNSQQGLEDIGLMRGLPNMVILQPGDEKETQQAVKFAMEHRGPVYMRLTRQGVEDVSPDNYSFELGKATILRNGTDITLFATGGVVHNAVKAAEILNNENISVRVVNVCSIKPIDKDLIAQCAKETRKLFTVEDHNIIGGLGSAVSEVVAETHPTYLCRLGLQDTFGESGTPSDLYLKYRLDAEGIASSIKEKL
jgi:transketolase